MSNTFTLRRLEPYLLGWLVVLSISATVQAQTGTTETGTVKTGTVETDAMQTDTAQADMEPLNPARNYLGAALSTVAADEGTPTLGVQFGVNVLERLELRGVLESNFSNLLASAEGFYRLNPTDAFGQPYVGGGVTVTGEPSGDETVVVTLPTLTGGYAYRLGVLEVFAELRAFVVSPLPVPELRAGVNVYS